MTFAPSPPATDGVGFRSERGPVLGALMLTTGLVALDSTIIATAVPSIVQDIGGFASGRTLQWSYNTPVIADGQAILFQPACGNGLPDPGEECDDGNQVNGDGCETTCTPTPTDRSPATCCVPVTCW